MIITDHVGQGSYEAGLIQPVGARHFATAVEAEEPGVAGGGEPVGSREDRGEAGVDCVGGGGGGGGVGGGFDDRLRGDEEAGDVG